MTKNFTDIEEIIKNPEGFLTSFYKEKATKYLSQKKKEEAEAELVKREQFCKKFNAIRVTYGLKSLQLSEALNIRSSTLSNIKYYKLNLISGAALEEIDGRLDVLVAKLKITRTSTSILEMAFYLKNRESKVDENLLREKALEEALTLWLDLNIRLKDLTALPGGFSSHSYKVVSYLTSTSLTLNKPSCKKILEAIIELRWLKKNSKQTVFKDITEKAQMYYRVKTLLKEKNCLPSYVAANLGIAPTVFTYIKQGRDEVTYTTVDRIIKFLEKQ